jgi:hypothetical protein
LTQRDTELYRTTRIQHGCHDTQRLIVFPITMRRGSGTNRFIWLKTSPLSSDPRRTSNGQLVSVASQPRIPAISVKWTSLPHIDLHCGQLIRTGDVDRTQGKLRDKNTDSLPEQICIDQQDRLTQRQTMYDDIGVATMPIHYYRQRVDLTRW